MTDFLDRLPEVSGLTQQRATALHRPRVQDWMKGEGSRASVVPALFLLQPPLLCHGGLYLQTGRHNSPSLPEAAFARCFVIAVRKAANLIKVIASKPGDLSLAPRTHAIEREKSLLQVVLWLLHQNVGYFLCSKRPGNPKSRPLWIWFEYSDLLQSLYGR